MPLITNSTGGHERHQGEGLPCCPSLRPCGRQIGRELWKIDVNVRQLIRHARRSNALYPSLSRVNGSLVNGDELRRRLSYTADDIKTGRDYTVFLVENPRTDNEGLFVISKVLIVVSEYPLKVYLLLRAFSPLAYSARAGYAGGTGIVVGMFTKVNKVMVNTWFSI